MSCIDELYWQYYMVVVNTPGACHVVLVMADCVSTASLCMTP